MIDMAKKKNILFVIGCLSSGGAERQLSGLANMLCDDYDITIVTWVDFDDHYKLDSRIKRVRISWGRTKILKLINVMLFVLKHKYDCVISYSQEDNLLALTPLLLKPKVKAIASERNYMSGKGTMVEKLLFRFLYRRAAYIVPNSYSQGEYIKSVTSFGEKVRVITNYTDTTLYKPKKHEPSSIIRFGVFARFAEQKNYRRFADAINILKNRASKPFEVHWYGKMKSFGIDNPGYSEFKLLIEKYGLSDIIHLHDHVADVANEMVKYDAIILMSLREGFSNVISEAICCGLPVLASDVSDNSVMVEHGYNGFLTNPLSVNQMATNIENFLLLSSEGKEVMGNNSRLKAESLFNKESFVSKYIHLIDS